MKTFWRAGVSKVSCRYAALLTIAALVAGLVWQDSAGAAAQLRAVTVALRETVGHVVFCVTEDTMIIAVADDGAAAAMPALGKVLSRMPAIVQLGPGRAAVVLGASEWTRNDDQPMLLDEELPAIVRKALNGMQKPGPAGQSATDIESIGLALLEFVRPFVDDVHYRIDLAPDEPLIEVLLAGYAEGYGPEIWNLRYRVQQRNLGNDYWETRPMRPSYGQLYPPEKDQPRTLIEVQYPPSLRRLNLAQAAQSDPAVLAIRNASEEINEAVNRILEGESNKADTGPAADFLRLALPAAAGSQSKLAIAAIDRRYRFQWLLAPDNAPAEIAPPPAQPQRPSLRRGGPPIAR